MGVLGRDCFRAGAEGVKLCLTMAQPLKTVSVLIANPALSSILATTLAAAPSLRVRQFESELALRSYLRLATADVLVTDFDSDAEAVAMRRCRWCFRMPCCRGHSTSAARCIS